MSQPFYSRVLNRDGLLQTASNIAMQSSRYSELLGLHQRIPGIDPADVLIFDDAHLAENAAHGLFSLDVSRFDHENLYNELVAAIADRFPHYSIIADYKEANYPPNSPTELVNFTDWQISHRNWNHWFQSRIM